MHARIFRVAGLMGAGMVLGLGLGAGAGNLTSWASSHFAGSGQCTFCHDSGGGALVDRAGGNLSITEDWRGTMMAHAFEDPLWRAVMAAEVEARPALKGFIEDKCQTCHAPMARTQRHRDGKGPLSFADATRDPLAADGVSCTLCHQIQPEGLGQDASFSGGYRIDASRRIFGPYPDPFEMPMRRHVDYTPAHGAHLTNSALCATCHTLHTPRLDADGRVVGTFPEQTPYLEWRAGSAAKAGKQCQDCHMQRVEEPVRISIRPPWLDPRTPFWRHVFVGGNTVLPQLLAATKNRDSAPGTSGTLEATVRQAREQLRRAARVTARLHREERDLVLDVEVANLTGHKFPTGHPYRRAWLHVRIEDARGRSVFESGAPESDGSLRGVGRGFQAHHDTIDRPEQVQVYESVMGDEAGQRTYGLLRAARYLKDNRLPPRGFVSPGAPEVAVVGGALEDADFNADASGTDRVTYRVRPPEGRSAGAWRARVALRYQAVPPESVAWLGEVRAPEAREFLRAYRRLDTEPETVDAVTVEEPAAGGSGAG